jgi:hypothetical protein
MAPNAAMRTVIASNRIPFRAEKVRKITAQGENGRAEGNWRGQQK